MKKNPFAARVREFACALAKNHCACAIVANPFNIAALTGIFCDNARLLVWSENRENFEPRVLFLTDFRYTTEISRKAPWLKIDDIKRMNGSRIFAPRKKFANVTIGYEETISHREFLIFAKIFPDAQFANILPELANLKSVKTRDEQEKIRAAARLNDEIWSVAKTRFRAGQTEREMARIIQTLMIERGEGEAFATIVCVGKNAAECHHVPDDTVWNGRDSVLVDMGVKCDGVCSDLTRNIVPTRPSRLYKKVYALVREANARAIASAKPGMTASALDRVARDFLAKNGLGRAFGHSLGHGVGREIHEAPWISRKQKTVLRPGMIFTIEPGVYLPDTLGVRIEDLVLMTENGCEVLSKAEK